MADEGDGDTMLRRQTKGLTLVLECYNIYNTLDSALMFSRSYTDRSDVFHNTRISCVRRQGSWV